MRLAELLSQTQQSLWQNAAPEEREQLPRKLKAMAAALEDATQNPLLLRTADLHTSAKNLKNVLGDATREASEHALPFLELLKPVHDDLIRFDSTHLDTLRELVVWLVEKNRLAPALSLAKEWLVSYLMVSLGDDNHHADHETRKPYETAIQDIAKKPRSRANEAESDSTKVSAIVHQAQEDIPGETLDKLVKLSSKIIEYRNDLNHAGFRSQPLRHSNIVKQVDEISRALYEFPLS